MQENQGPGSLEGTDVIQPNRIAEASATGNLTSGRPQFQARTEYSACRRITHAFHDEDLLLRCARRRNLTEAQNLLVADQQWKASRLAELVISNGDPFARGLGPGVALI